MPIELKEINPENAPGQKDLSPITEDTYKYSTFSQDSVCPVEKHGKMLFTSGISNCTAVLIKFHQSGNMVAAHISPMGSFQRHAEALKLPSKEKISVVIITQPHSTFYAHRCQEEIENYFKDSIECIEVVEQDTNHHHLSVLYDQEKDSLYLAYYDHGPHIVQASSVFNWDAHLIEQNASMDIEALVQKNLITREDINRLDPAQYRQLCFYHDVIIKLVNYISFNELFNLNEKMRILLLDHSEQITSLLEIDAHFLTDFFDLNWDNKYQLFASLNETVFLLEEIKKLSNTINEDLRIELYSHQYAVNYLIKAGLSLSAFLEFDSEKRVSLLNASWSILEFSKLNLTVQEWIGLDEILRNELLKNNFSVFKLCSLGLNIKDIIEFTSDTRTLLLSESNKFQSLVKAGINVQDFITFDTDVQIKLLRLSQYEMEQLLQIGVNVPEIMKLDSKLRAELLSNSCHIKELVAAGMNVPEIIELDPALRAELLVNSYDIKKLVAVGMSVPEIIELDPALRAELLSNSYQINELVTAGMNVPAIIALDPEMKKELFSKSSAITRIVTAGMPILELVKLNSEVRKELYQLAYEENPLLEKIKVIQQGEEKNSNFASSFFAVSVHKQSEAIRQIEPSFSRVSTQFEP